MSTKQDLLKNILDSLSDEESSMIEKTATDAGVLKDTENKEAKEKIRTESPTSTEGKLGLSVLSKNKHEEEFSKVNSPDTAKSDNMGTQNISVKMPNAEPGVTFEKKASAEVIEKIYEASGIDLSKTASEDSTNEMLLKVAFDTMEELKDLEKIAEVLAEETASRFIEKISSYIE